MAAVTVLIKAAFVSSANLYQASFSVRMAAAASCTSLLRNPACKKPSSIEDALFTVETSQAEPTATQAPAVPIKKSVFPDFIICLEDGKKLKMLKRHLQTSYNMTPAAYREKWKLPDNYPMVAPAYASHRSTLAKSIGLGRRRAETGDAQPPVTRVPARRAKGSKG